MKTGKYIAALLMGVVICGNGFAQEFGFGFDDDAESAASSPTVSVKVGGEVAVEIAPFVHDFDEDGTQAISFWDMVSGKLNFKVEGGNVEAIAAFNLHSAAIRELWNATSTLGDPSYTPLIMDEAYLRAFIGPVNIEAGLRKLTWGKADSLGPLDVINPLDYSDLSKLSDIQSIKIARPMVHASWNISGFSKLEAVFIPNFAGDRFAREGRWAASQFRGMYSVMESEISSKAADIFGPAISSPQYAALFDGAKGNLLAHFDNDATFFPSTGGLDYFQTGLRFTTTVGPADIGAQYYYGNLFQPSFAIDGIETFLMDLASKNSPPDPNNPYFGDPSLLYRMNYSRYHQIGVDYAQVLFGFNIRSEVAFHLTEDLSGDDGALRNPFVGWSLGFDRDLFWGINANIQCNETVRLFNSGVGENPIMDSEADTDVTSTRITFRLSRMFLRDEFECKLTGIWGIEQTDCYLIPAVAWSIRDMTAELSAGIFVGEKSGELGQYWENSYVKLALKYTF